MTTACPECSGTIIEYDSAAGNGFCVACGTVVEENTIVSELTFGETSNGGAMVQGAYVGQGATHARMSGPYGNRSSGESREQTIANANRKIQSIAHVLRLSETICLAATRMFTLAVEHKFTRGRKGMNVVAVCLYVACRQKETHNYMLIDFSDLLQVNVFELGHTYLQLVQTLNLRLPLVDPSHYISRFAALLEFGEETSKVATDAVRVVQRFDRDWMTKGRRPAGICGAALLLAARMNNFRRSVQEIVQVVKIADVTLKKRLEEFKSSPSGQLTMADFRSVWLDEEMDPPAFVKAREKEEMEKAMAEEQQNEPVEEEIWDAEKELAHKLTMKEKFEKKRRKKKRKREENDDAGREDSSPLPEEVRKEVEAEVEAAPVPVDPSLLNKGILADTTEKDGDFDVDLDDDSADSALGDPTRGPATNPVDDELTNAVAEEVNTFLENDQGVRLTGALDEAEERRLAQIQANVVDELQGLDEDELDKFLLTEDEVRIKERVWVELNKDYLEALAAKGEEAASGGSTKQKRRRRGTTLGAKPRDSSTPHGSSAAESVRKMLQKNKRYSKRINYDALKDLFVDTPSANAIEATYGRNMDDDKDDDFTADLYTMDDKSDGEGMGTGMVVIEEGAVVQQRNHEGEEAPAWDDSAGDDYYFEQEV